MAYFDLELDMIDGLSVDSGGVGSLREIVNTSPNPLQSSPGARKIILNGDTTDMVGAIITTFGGTQSYVAGQFSQSINATDYSFVYTAPVLSTNTNLTNPGSDTKTLWLTTQSAEDYQISGVDNEQVFRKYTFPKDLPLDYQPEINYLDERLDVIEATPDGGGWGSVYRLGTDALLLNGDTTTKCRVSKGSATITGTYSSSADKTTYPLNLGNDPFHIDTTTLQVFKRVGGVATLPYIYFTLPGDLPLNYQPQIDSLDGRMDTAEGNITDLQDRVGELESAGGYLDAYTIVNTDTANIQYELSAYAMTELFGNGGVFHVPSNSTFTAPAGANYTVVADLATTTPLKDCTYVISNTTHTVFEIPNATKVKNTSDNHTWSMYRSVQSATSSSVWKDIGFDSVGVATDLVAGIVKASSDISVDEGGKMRVYPKAKQLVRGYQRIGTTFRVMVNQNTTVFGDTTQIIYGIGQYADGSYTALIDGALNNVANCTNYDAPLENSAGSPLTRIILTTNSTFDGVHFSDYYSVAYVNVHEETATATIPGTVLADTLPSDGTVDPREFFVDNTGKVTLTEKIQQSAVPAANTDDYDWANYDTNPTLKFITPVTIAKVEGLLNANTEINEWKSTQFALAECSSIFMHGSDGSVQGQTTLVFLGDVSKATTGLEWFIKTYTPGTTTTQSTNISSRMVYNPTIDRTIYARSTSDLPSIYVDSISAVKGYGTENAISVFTQKILGISKHTPATNVLGEVTNGGDIDVDPLTGAMSVKNGAVGNNKLASTSARSVKGNLTGNSAVGTQDIGMTQLSEALADPSFNSAPVALRSWVTTQLAPYAAYLEAHANPSEVRTFRGQHLDLLQLITDTDYQNSGVPLDQSTFSAAVILGLLGNAGNGAVVRDSVGTLIPALTLLRTVMQSVSIDNAFYDAKAITAMYNGLSGLIKNNTDNIAALSGSGGYLDYHDFGTNTPTQQQLTQYACQYIWGDGVLTWTPDTSVSPTYYGNNTYTVTATGDVHIIGSKSNNAATNGIFNATKVVNTADNSTWELASTPDTSPPVFSWENRGVTNVSIATTTAAGIVRGGGDITVNADGDMFIGQGKVTANSLESNFALPYSQMQTEGGYTVLGNATGQGRVPAEIALQDLINILSGIQQTPGSVITNNLVALSQLNTAIETLNTAIGNKSMVSNPSGVLISNPQIHNTKYNGNDFGHVYNCDYINNLPGGGGSGVVNPYTLNGGTDGIGNEITLDYTYFGKQAYAQSFDITLSQDNTNRIVLVNNTNIENMFKSEGLISFSDGYQVDINSYFAANSTSGTEVADNGYVAVEKMTNGDVCLIVKFFYTPTQDKTAKITIFYTKAV